MQVLEVLADDSNFRSMAMKLSAAPTAAMLTLPPEAFESAWCAGEATASVRLSRLSSASQFPTSTLHAPLYTSGAGIMGVVACQGVMAQPFHIRPWAHIVLASRLRHVTGLANDMSVLFPSFQ